MTSFYRHYRPSSFSQIVGQQHIIKTLQSALAKDRVAHAYLFAGPRGTGKTTIARILAQAVNCEPVKGKLAPCNECVSCKSVTAGRAVDIIEVDAASNRGIDEIRELRDKIRISPSQLKYKVYIIDEVHMLTDQAFNALLKTLEEPPAHAKFIFATTEIHKVPATILSRTQRFDFHRANRDELKLALEPIIKSEKIKINPDALETLVSLAEGSYRDAVSLLDQVSSITKAEITQADIELSCGLSGQDQVVKYLKAASSGDIAEALAVINRVTAQSGNLGYFIGFLQEYFRQFLHFRLAGDKLNLPVAKELLLELEVLAGDFTPEEIICWLEGLTAAERQTKVARISQLPLEVLTGRLVKPANNELPENEPIIEKLNIKIKNIIVKEGPKPDADDMKNWRKALEQIKVKNLSLYGLLSSAEVLSITGDEVSLRMGFDLHCKKVTQPSSLKAMGEIIEKAFGRKVKISCQVDGKLQAKPELDDNTLAEVIEVFGG